MQWMEYYSGNSFSWITPPPEWLEHFIANLQVVDLKPAHTCVCGMNPLEGVAPQPHVPDLTS